MMNLDIILLLSIAFFIFWFWYKNQKNSKLPIAHSRTAASEVAEDDAGAKYRCVVIEPGWSSCKAVKQYEAMQMLLDEAPALPVKKCDNDTCQCEFIHFEDRRRSDRRSDELASQLESKGNKRKGEGRRQSDVA
jgi:hypothetical protein